MDQFPEITTLVWSRGELCPLGYKVIEKIHTEEGPKLTLKGDTKIAGPSGEGCVDLKKQQEQDQYG